MSRWRAWWRDMRLSTRIVGTTLLLLLIVQLAGFVLVRAGVERQARGQVAEDLAVGERVWLRLLQQRAERLSQGSMLLAADFGFRSAIGTADAETIQSALENHGQRIGAEVAALLDPRLELVAASTPLQGMAGQVLREVATDLSRDSQGGRIALFGKQPFQFVMVPVRAPVIIGWVLMGFPVNQALVDDMYRVSAVHAAVFSGANPTQLVEVVSTLTNDAEALRMAAVGMGTEVFVNEQALLLRQVDLPSVNGTVRTVLLRSISEVVTPFRELQLLLALITLAGVVLFALGSGLITRRITQPLGALTRATRALEQGDFNVEVGNTERGDELGLLARGFDTMRTSLAAQQAEIRRLAYWDRLTGLPNRERFREVLMQAIEDSRNTARPLAVITLNLDRFKHVNDVLGYAFGDELLKAVSGRLKQQVYREGDLVARLGGDEFAILLSRTDAQGAVALTHRIVKAFEAPLAFEDQTVDLSASMGVACWPTDAPEADLLMSRSEIAMHAAKTRTAGVLLYSPGLDSSSSETLSLLSDLRTALRQGELRLFLQPKVAVADDSVVGAEALVRWQHPTRGLVPPLQFIPFAEQTGFVRQLTLWMFEEAARCWKDLQPEGGRLRVSINLSTRDLLDQDFPLRLSGLLGHYGLTADAFCLEITESAIMDDPQRAEATLNRLAAQGFKLSIDDFGTGYSSLAYLKRLPVNELKIDKSFVMGMAEDDSDAKIVRSTIDLAHNLGLSVVAEGVETEALLQRLHDLRCDEAQGYHIGKPQPASEFVAWRARWLAARRERAQA